MTKKIFFLLLCIFSLSVANAQWVIDEGFEDTYWSDDWTTFEESAYGYMFWDDDQDAEHSGENAAGCYTFYDIDTWLVSPKVQITDGDIVSFWFSSYWEENNHVQILISEEATATEDTSDYVLLSPEANFYYNQEAFKFYSFDLSAYAGKEVFVAWRVLGDEIEAGGTAGYAVIDDVKIGKELPITIGEGTVADNTVPTCVYWKYSYTQEIYTHAELNTDTPKLIDKLAFNYNGNSAWTEHTKIYIGHTKRDNFVASGATWIPEDSLKLVYDDDFSVTADSGWVDFKLESSFVYNGEDNIVIAFFKEEPYVAHNESDGFYTSSVTPYRTMVYRNDYSDFVYNKTPIKQAKRANVKISFKDLAAEPQMILNTDTLDFGKVCLGDSTFLKLNVENLGGANLSIEEMKIVGADKAHFQLENLTFPIDIETGNIEQFNIKCLPVEEGIKTAYLKIVSNSGLDSVALVGNSIDATIREFPYGEDFEHDGNLPFGWTQPDGNVWTLSREAHGGLYAAKVSYKNVGSLISPKIVLPDNMEISFWWIDKDVNNAKVATHDTTFFEVRVEQSGSEWETLAFLSPENNDEEYHQERISLAAYSGQTIRIRFRNEADGSYSAYGTGIDDIVIEKSGVVLSPPFTEPFATDTVLPEGWTTASKLLSQSTVLDAAQNADSLWKLTKYANNSEKSTAISTSFSHNQGLWFISPTIVLEHKKYLLKYDLALTANGTAEVGTMENDDQIKVLLSRDNGATWSAAPDYVLKSYNADYQLDTNVCESVELSQISGNIKIAFYIESTAGSNNSEVFFDNIQIIEKTDMPEIMVSVGAFEQTMGQDITATQNFNIQNIGTADLTFDLKLKLGSETPTWVSLNTQSGTILPSKTSNIELTFNSTNLEAGNYNTNLIILHNGENMDSIVLPIALTVEASATAPQISVSAESFEQTMLQDTVATYYFSISNNGNAELTFDIELKEGTTTPTWVTVNHQSGAVAADNAMDISLKFNSHNLDAGTYQADLLIAHNVEGTDMLALPITLTVTEGDAPNISVSVTSISENMVADTAKMQNFSIQNTGTADLTFDLILKDGDQTPSWVGVEPQNATVAPNASENITLNFNSENLDVGTYQANLLIAHNVEDTDTLVLPITLTVEQDTIGLQFVENEGVVVYPCPCSTTLNIDFNDNDVETITIFSTDGKIVRKINVEKYNKCNLDVSNLATGVYSIRFSAKNKIFTRKIIKN